jgi:predicted peptidase
MLVHVLLFLATTTQDPSLSASLASDHGFVDRVYKDSEGTESKYVVFVPHCYTPEKAWPTILFLHGAGERGGDGAAQVKVGLGPAILKREKTFPFIVVFPQCASGGSWQSTDGKRALEILGEVEHQYRVDPNRVYLTGWSLGGMGTWSLSIQEPDRFAAIAPVCGRGDTSQAVKIAHLPIWCFHGEADRVVPDAGSRSMIEAIKEAGGHPKYTEYPGVGHDSWVQAYDTDGLYTWLLEQVRKAEKLQLLRRRS